MNTFRLHLLVRHWPRGFHSCRCILEESGPKVERYAAPRRENDGGEDSGLGSPQKSTESSARHVASLNTDAERDGSLRSAKVKIWRSNWKKKDQHTIEPPTSPSPTGKPLERAADIPTDFAPTAKQDASPRTAFSELFPDLATDTEEKARLDQDTNAKKLKTNVHFPDSRSERIFTVPQKRLPWSKSATDKGWRSVDSDIKSTVVLKLACASNTLTEADFRRLIPRGRHIEDWMSRGDFVRVIPRREKLSLQRVGEYYLVFANAKDAGTYMERALAVWRQAVVNTPNSIYSPMAPPAGIIAAGEDLQQLVQSFTLCPPQQEIRLRKIEPAEDEVRSMIMEHGGYPLITRKKSPHHAKVLLHTGGMALMKGEIKALASEARERWGVSFNLVSDGVQKLYDLVMEEVEQLQLHEGDPVKMFGRTWRQLLPHKTHNCWILTFEDKDSAISFANTWYGRKIDMGSNKNTNEAYTTFATEYLW